MSSNQFEAIDDGLEPSDLDVVYDPLWYPEMVSWFNPDGSDEEWLRVEASLLVDLEASA